MQAMQRDAQEGCLFLPSRAKKCKACGPHYPLALGLLGGMDVNSAQACAHRRVHVAERQPPRITRGVPAM
jgi:hypothetical protein